jgi:hypothetical protein
MTGYYYLGTQIKENRWSGKFPDKPVVTKAQRELMKKLQRAVAVASNNHREDLSEAAMAVLEFLPNCPTLAVIFAEIYKLTPDVILELRTVFNVTKPGDN